PTPRPRVAPARGAAPPLRAVWAEPDRVLRQRRHRLPRCPGDGGGRSSAPSAVRRIVQRLDRGPRPSGCNRTRAGVAERAMILSLALLLSATSHASDRAALAKVTAAEISGHLRFLADDMLEGRKPGQPGSDLAIKYLASQLEAFGYKPGGDNGTFLQPVPLIELRAEVPRDIHFSANGQDVTLHALGGTEADLVLEPNAHIDRATVKDAPVVFAGYGITAPEYGWDDYKDVDVRGKIVVLMNFNPPFKGPGVRLWYGRWDYKYDNAARHGAAGALVIDTTASAGYPWQVIANRADGTHQDLPPSDAEPRSMQFQGWIAEHATVKLLQAAGQELDAFRRAAESRDFRPQAMGSTLTLEMAIARREIRS